MLVGLEESSSTRLGIQQNMSTEEVAHLKKENLNRKNMPDIRIA